MALWVALASGAQRWRVSEVLSMLCAKNRPFACGQKGETRAARAPIAKEWNLPGLATSPASRSEISVRKRVRSCKHEAQRDAALA